MRWKPSILHCDARESFGLSRKGLDGICCMKNVVMRSVAFACKYVVMKSAACRRIVMGSVACTCVVMESVACKCVVNLLQMVMEVWTSHDAVMQWKSEVACLYCVSEHADVPCHSFSRNTLALHSSVLL